MTAYIFDTETTGLVDPEIVQTAWTELAESFPLREVSSICEFWSPSKPIELGALATHHIMEEDLVEAPPASEFALPADCTYLIGHNIDFDWRAIGSPPKILRIDTLPLARHFWPKLDSHTQSALLYHLERETARERLQYAHDALADCKVCLTILQHIVAATLGTVTSFEQLWNLSEIARVPTVWSFGKHKGQAIKDTPRAYLQWCLKQEGFDPYVLKAVRGAL